MDDTGLRRCIRARFLTGDLPMKLPTRTRVGPGSKRTCAVCDVGIESVAEIEADSTDGRIRFYHPRCYDLVFVERQLLQHESETV